MTRRTRTPAAKQRVAKPHANQRVAKPTAKQRVAKPTAKQRVAKPTAKQRVAKPSEKEIESLRLVHQLEVHQVELELQNEELRTTRVELETGLARYRELFDFAPIGYATLGPDDDIVELNHVGARILGLERGLIIGWKFASLLEPTTVHLLAAMLARARAQDSGRGPGGSCEVVRQTPRIWLRMSASRLPRSATLLLAFEDITELKADAERLAETERALREAHRRKDEFLATLSHELRNPLAPISTSLFVMARAELGSAEARAAHEIIERQVKHMSRLVDDLLDITRITRGKIRLRRERLELCDLVKRTLDDHRAGFEASGIELSARFAEGVMWVDADPARIAQSVSNALGNAEKFTLRGGKVLVTLERDAGRAVLRIRDSGVGIAAEELPHLFEPFAQGPQNLDRSRGGLGLGLSMVKSLVELHGGAVELSSPGVGSGSELAIWLPLVPAPRRSPNVSYVAPGTRRILVIEDNPQMAQSLTMALTLVGHHAEQALDGRAGIARAREFHPDVVLCDIGLPDIDGYQVARALRAEANLGNVFLVALSGYAQPEDLRRATRAGFDRHIAKPAQLETLLRLLADVPSV